MPKKLYIHPLLIGVIPFLNYLANNIGQIHLQAALRTGAAVLVICSVLYLLLLFIIRSSGKAALLASFLLITFYSYGHVFQMLNGKSLLGFVYGRHLVLMILWLALIFAGSLFILRKIKENAGPNRILNFVSLFLLLLPVYQIGRYYIVQKKNVVSESAVSTPFLVSTDESSAVQPDVYYIIMDGYSRADVLQELYDLDISPFTNELKQMGFVFPECAQSNYGFTGFSLSSALNMDYVDTFAETIPWGAATERYNASLMHDYIRHSLVRAAFKQLGYTIVTFDTGTPLLDVDDSDYFIEFTSTINKNGAGLQLSTFEHLFIKTTMLSLVFDENSRIMRAITGQLKTPHRQQHERALYVLDQLGKVHTIPGKKFVFFHIMAPHDPYVFDAEGNYVANESLETVPGYTDEVKYLNKRLPEIVRSLITNSETPPVIIIQGDHGWDPRPQYKMKILNAYYLPNGGDKLLYPTITPVNTFRLIFNHYFGANLDFLEDRSFYSLPSPTPEYLNAAPYKPVEVPIDCPVQ